MKTEKENIKKKNGSNRKINYIRDEIDFLCCIFRCHLFIERQINHVFMFINLINFYSSVNFFFTSQIIESGLN